MQACEECVNMSKRLHEVPNSIEELSDKREWMKQIPEQIRNYRVRSRDSILEKKIYNNKAAKSWDHIFNHFLCPTWSKKGGTKQDSSRL